MDNDENEDLKDTKPAPRQHGPNRVQEKPKDLKKTLKKSKRTKLFHLKIMSFLLVKALSILSALCNLSMKI